MGVATVQGGGLTNDTSGNTVEVVCPRKGGGDFTLSEGGSVPLLVVEMCGTALCDAAPRIVAWEGGAME